MTKKEKIFWGVKIWGHSFRKCWSNSIRSINMQSLLSGKDNRRWEQKIESIKIYEAFVEDNQSIIDSEIKNC